MGVKMKSKVFSIFLTLSVALFGANTFAVQADERPLTFAEAVARYGGESTQMWGLGLTEDFAEPSPSALWALSQAGTKTITTYCSNITDDPCQGAVDLYQVLHLDKCEESSQLSCIADFWAVDPSGKKINGEFVRPILFESKQATKENLDLNIPASSSIYGLWRVPGVLNSSGTDTYLVGTHVTMFRARNEAKFTYGEINSGIFTSKEVSGNYGLTTVSKAGISGTGPSRTPEGQDCIALEIGKCHVTANFPEGYRFGMTLRVGEKLNGWYHGRLSLPSIEVKSWKKGEEIAIEAEPVKVPSVDFVVPITELSESQQKEIRDCVLGNCGSKGNIKGVLQTGGNLAGPQTMNLLMALATAFKDRATNTTTAWAFRNMFNHGGSIDSGKIARCTQKDEGLNGLVFTNALTYSSGPPAFDDKTGSLVYKVASPHFEANGGVASGTYDLTMRSNIARCLYDFSSAAIKAEVSITGSDGENRVATTLVNERDGWLYLSAKGFTFSAPTIRVKLTQDKKSDQVQPQTDSKQAVASPAVKPTVKRSITCVKGKVTKKVSGVSPKCPTGFKRK